MVVAIHEYGLLGGADWDGAWAGGPRALFSFFVGVLLFRVRQRYRAPATPVLLLALLLLLAFVPGEIGGWVYNRACIALLFPLLVWLAADAAMGPQTRAAGNFLGYLSYPIYLLQAPFFLWLAPVSVRLDRAMPTGGVLELVLYILVIVAGSWAVARWFDTPVREWLRRRIAPEAAQPRAQSAP
jgi:peptidoglycan/LPS O-acetylase OafA/YrhL